jgi:tRNA(Ile)-lysidine synthase
MLLRRVTRLIARNGLLNPNDTVIIGASAGPDSTALLILLSEIDLALDCLAVYIDHGLRPQETEMEIETVRRLALRFGTRFCCKAIPVEATARANGWSIEEAARILRYRALETIRTEAGGAAIAVAHTADDQVEEFLLRTIRGSGRNGLAGMPYRQGHIIRPLLDESKQTLIDFLQKRHTLFCLDSSNQDRRYLRNRVRLDLLPALAKDFNPAIRRTILQTMDILRQEEDLLDTLTRTALQPLPQFNRREQEDGHKQHLAIPLTLFAGQHPAIRRRMLEQLAWRMATRLSFRQIEQLLSLIEGGENGGEVHLGGGLRAKKSAGGLLFSYPRGRTAFRGSGREDVLIDTVISGPGTYVISGIDRILTIAIEKRPPSLRQHDRLFVDAGKITFPLRLQTIAAGQRFTPFGLSGSKKVNRFLCDRGIPAERRRLYPVLCSEGRIIALPGLAIDDEYRITAATRSVLAIDWRQLPPETDQPAGAAL